MVARFIHGIRLLIVLASRHRTLVLENLALQQQLAVYRRTRPKPAIRWSDRLFLGRTAMDMAGLEIGSGGRPASDGRRLASARLRVVLDAPIAAAGRPTADRR